MVKIRLKRMGKKRKPFYHVIVADARTARDGKIIDKVGTYDPMTTPSRKSSYMDKKWCKTYRYS